MDTLAALQVYKELADWYERQGQAAMRDRFLILAAEAAFSAGKSEEAERLRQRLLQGNPHHMLKPFSSFAQALQSTNIQIYIHDLQVNYPPETAAELLRNLRSGVPPTPAEAGPSAAETAPVVEVRDEPTPDAPQGPLQVYPLRDEPGPTPPPALPAPPPQKKRPTRYPTPLPRTQPILPRSPRPAAAPLPPSSESAAPAGVWLPLLLFGMTVTAGVALAFYTLARPFLPPEWLL